MTETLTPADPVADQGDLRRLNLAYFAYLERGVRDRFGLSLEDLLDCPITEYVDAAVMKLGSLSPPMGVFYIARAQQTPVGMGGLRALGEGVAEVKRIFVAPEYRGGGLGRRILRQLIADAKTFGFSACVLDSAPFMTAAHHLYKAEGFIDIAPFPQAEGPTKLHHDWRFMQLTFC